MLFLILSLLYFQEPDYPKKLQELNVTYQNCLDEGQAMVGCSRVFLSQMGELMDQILIDNKENGLKAKTDSILQNQRKWEVKIQDKFDHINHRLDSLTQSNGAVTHEEMMFANNDKAMIIEKRVLELIKLLD